MGDPYEIQQDTIHRTRMEMREGGIKLHPIMPRVSCHPRATEEAPALTPYVLAVLALILATLICDVFLEIL